MKKNFISYGKQFIGADDIRSIIKAAKSEKITQGIYVDKFEENLKNYFGSKYCKVVNNGTSALYLAIKSLRLKKGDHFVTSPITFLSSAYTAMQNGLVPNFCDINTKTYNLDLNKLETILKKNSKIRLVIGVDYAGYPCDWKAINFLKKKYRLFLLNDNCHAMGSKLSDSKKYAVKYADLVTQSYHPVKNITTGEGGSILTNNETFYKRIKSLSNHGIIKSNKLNYKYGPWFYELKDIGFNFRISDILCALGITQLKKLDYFVKKRREIAKIYDKNFNKLDFFQIPQVEKKYFHSYHLYPALIDFKKFDITRKIFFKEMLKKRINLQVHYIPLYKQPFLKKFNFEKKNYTKYENFYFKVV